MELFLIFFLSFSIFAKEDLKANFLIFGDSGYNREFPDPEAKDGRTMEDWIKGAEKKGDIKNKKAVLPPLIPNPFKKRFYFEDSGAFRVGKAMTNFCTQNSCELAFMLGDNIYFNGAQGDAEDEKRFRTLIYLPFKNIEKKNKDFRFYAILGNHDWYSHEFLPDNIPRMKELALLGIYSQMEYFARPGSRFLLNPQSTDPKRDTYYKISTHDGKIDFFGIDTYKMLGSLEVKDYKDPSKLAINLFPRPKEELDQQIKWLEESLKNSKAKWKIVFGHHPIYSVGGTKWPEALVLKEKLLPILCKFADIYMAGHEHDLEYHVAPCEGQEDLELLISGAASRQRSVGITQYSQKLIKEQEREYKFAKGMVWGFSHLSIKNNKATVKILQVDNNGKYKTLYTRTFKRRIKNNEAK